MTLGDSGIFGKARTAKEQTNIKSATELMNLKILEIKTKGYAENETVDLQYLANNLIADTEIEYVSNISNPTEPYASTIDTTGKTAIYTKLKAYPYEFTINDGMEVTNIDGQTISAISSGGSSTGSGSTSGGTATGSVSDYTTNLLYRTDYANMQNGQNGVTLPATGVTINSQGNYVTFDGTNRISIDKSVVDPENKLAGTSTKTLTMWYRSNTTTGSAVPAVYGSSGSGTTMGFNIVSLKSIAAYANCAVCDRVVDCAEVTDGKWHLCVATWSDGNKIRFYFDGVPFEAGGSYSTNADALWIGCMGNDNLYLYTGDVGEVRLYEGALTTDNVLTLLEYGRQTYYSRNPNN